MSDLKHPNLSDFSKSINQIGDAFVTIKNHQLADHQFGILKNTIIKFQNTLAEDEEVSVLLSSFGQSVMVYVNAITYSNPCLFHFYGFLENGTRVGLVQHVNQLNFLLMASKKLDPDLPARRIGFSAD